MGHNILLVTDDRETKKLLMLHLNSNGFTVDIAENEEMFNVCFGHQKTNLIHLCPVQIQEQQASIQQA